MFPKSNQKCGKRVVFDSQNVICAETLKGSKDLLGLEHILLPSAPPPHPHNVKEQLHHSQSQVFFFFFFQLWLL